MTKEHKFVDLKALIKEHSHIINGGVETFNWIKFLCEVEDIPSKLVKSKRGKFTLLYDAEKTIDLIQRACIRYEIKPLRKHSVKEFYFVYILKIQELKDTYKIGISHDVKHRLEEINKCSLEVNLQHTYELVENMKFSLKSQASKVEREIKYLLKDYKSTNITLHKTEVFTIPLQDLQKILFVFGKYMTKSGTNVK